jgi:hypothetical protein
LTVNAFVSESCDISPTVSAGAAASESALEKQTEKIDDFFMPTLLETI